MGNTENLAQANVEPPGSADDAEQNIVPALARGIDRADLLYAFAPKPLLMTITLHDAGHTYSPEYVASSLDLLDEYKRAYGLLGAGDRVSLQATTVSHGYVYEMRRATYAWFNRWFEMKNVDDDETSQAVEPDATLFVTPTGFVTTSFGGETALSLTRQMADAIHTPSSLSADDVRTRDSQRARHRGVARRGAGGPRPRHDQESRDIGRNSSSSRAIGRFARRAGCSRRTTLALPRLPCCTSARRRRGARSQRTRSPSGCAQRADAASRSSTCADAATARSRYPPRGRFYFPGRIPDEAYLTWFTLMLGKPLLGGQVYDTLRALDYLRSRPDVGGAVSLVGDGPHGVIALYAAALDARVRGVALAADRHGLSFARRRRTLHPAVRHLRVRHPAGIRPARRGARGWAAAGAPAQLR